MMKACASYKRQWNIFRTLNKEKFRKLSEMTNFETKSYFLHNHQLPSSEARLLFLSKI